MSTDRKPIEGKVASVLTERELAINIGSNDGVRAGMKFKVLAATQAEIIDPITNEILGYVDRVKVHVQADYVEKRYSVCKTYIKHYVGGGIFSGLDLSSKPREVFETLKAEDSSLSPPLTEEESYVKKGDRVVQIFSNDD